MIYNRIVELVLFVFYVCFGLRALEGVKVIPHLSISQFLVIVGISTLVRSSLISHIANTTIDRAIEEWKNNKNLH